MQYDADKSSRVGRREGVFVDRDVDAESREAMGASGQSGETPV